MNGEIWPLAAACGTFAGTHFALSHPLRAPLVRGLGERGFLALYSLIAIAAVVWIAAAYGPAAGGRALWDGFAPLPWTLTSVLTIAALALVLPSLRGNPALPQTDVTGLATREPQGVFRLTRHPMMMGFALWAVSHIIVAPAARSVILCITIIVVALGGSVLQDIKKLGRNHREWSGWIERTRFWPDLRQIGAIGLGVWAGSLAAWLGVTALHWWLAGIPAGIWRLLPASS